MYDNGKWLEKLQWFANSPAIPHMTFAEAHQRTGRVLSITCTSQRKHNPSLLLNYLTTPHVCIDSAILASAAVPGFIQPVVLMEKHPVTGVIRPFHDKVRQHTARMRHSICERVLGSLRLCVMVTLGRICNGATAASNVICR